jgi:hypothetical protein
MKAQHAGDVLWRLHRLHVGRCPRHRRNGEQWRGDRRTGEGGRDRYGDRHEGNLPGETKEGSENRVVRGSISQVARQPGLQHRLNGVSIEHPEHPPRALPAWGLTYPGSTLWWGDGAQV